ncbi:MAG: hypothetical protein ACI8UO_001769 [Verrucomicrobiales bacterium]|jgi:hypothetical protein
MNTKFTSSIFILAGISAGALLTANAEETFAEKILTKVDADFTVYEIKTKLEAEADETAAQDADGASDAPEEDLSIQPLEEDTIAKMEALLTNAERMAQKLKTLSDGSFRDTEIGDWNAKHNEIKQLLFEVLQSEDNGEISDDLAPVLEAIRKQFRLEAADLTSG